MSCVPFEQHTFEFGPRDYLNQLVSLVGTLRGGQKRYLPLLLEKIDIMPGSVTTGYPLPAAPISSRLAEIYEEHSTSGESSPYGSPLISPTSGQTFPVHDLGLGRPPTSASFPVTIPTSMQFGNGSTSVPPQLYQVPLPMDFEVTLNPLKYEPAG